MTQEITVLWKVDLFKGRSGDLDFQVKLGCSAVTCKLSSRRMTFIVGDFINFSYYRCNNYVVRKVSFCVIA